MLHEENKYVREFKSVSERMRDNYTNYKVILREKCIPNIHNGTTNNLSNFIESY